MTVTSHDVARLAGVSQATVSRALRHDARVTEATQRRVRDAAAALGYVTSELGRGLSTRSTRRIALVVELENTLYHQLMAPIHDELLERGYRMSLLAERGEDSTLSERLLDRSVDGAILMTTRLNSRLPLALERQRLPFVFLNRTSDLVAAPSVSADNVGGARSAAELLVRRGHNRVGAIFGPSDTSTARDREAGFRDALDEAGIALPSRRLFRGEYDHAAGRLGFETLVGASDPPTAIFCANDFIAIGALNMATQLGMTVPDDVAVVGFDDIDMAAWPAFQLTTVHNPLLEMAQHTATLLVNLVEGRNSEVTREIYPTSVVVRQTHG